MAQPLPSSGVSGWTQDACMRLEDLTPGTTLRGVIPAHMVTVVAVQWYGSDALELTYKDADGRPGTRLLYREEAAALTVDREFEHLGYDIESHDPRTGRLRFIEVKGRVAGAETITVTRNEILYALNTPDAFILALVVTQPDGGHTVAYLRQPFQREPDFGVTSVNYTFAELLARATQPS